MQALAWWADSRSLCRSTAQSPDIRLQTLALLTRFVCLLTPHDVFPPPIAFLSMMSPVPAASSASCLQVKLLFVAKTSLSC